jgi:soluble lytic murein transglycosylase
MLVYAALLVSTLAALPQEQAFLDAWELQSLNRPAAAAEAFASLGEAESPLAAFARIRAAENLVEAGAADRAAALLRAVVETHESGPEALLARVRLAEILAAQEKNDEAALLYTSVLNVVYRPWWLQSYLWDAANTVAESPSLCPLAYAYFREVAETSESPSDRLHAACCLEKSDAAVDWLAAAAAYLRAGQTRKAASLLARAMPAALEQEPLQARVRDLNAWLLTGTGEGEQGQAVLRQAATDHAGEAWVQPALLYSVRNLAGQDRLNDAEAVAEILAGQFPGTEETGSAWWTIARAYVVRDRTADAHRAYSRLAEAAPTYWRANEALFLIAMDHLLNNRPEAAKQRLEQIQRANPHGRYGSAANFWLGHLAQQAGNTEAARERFEEALTATMGDFYAHRARGRLCTMQAGTIDGTPLAGGVSGNFLHTLPAPPVPVVDVDMPAEQAAELERLRFFASHGFEEAEWTALYLLNLSEAPQPYLYWELMRAGLVETASGYMSTRFAPETPNDEALLAYLEFPVAFWPLVKQVQAETGIDPYLLLAVALRESTFRAWVRSPVGAQGLMQVMPATADWLTRVEPALNPETARQLDRPLQSLRLGAYYLMRMIERSNGNLVYAIASYNAGPGNVSKWRRSFGEIEIDEFIERIPFPETRHYVKTVLGAWAAYRSLYPDLEQSVPIAEEPAATAATAVLVPKHSD